METVNLEILIHILKHWLKDPASRQSLTAKFESLVGDNEILGATENQEKCFRDLCHDLAFYSQDPRALREDSTLWDDNKMENEINNMLSKILAEQTNET